MTLRHIWILKMRYRKKPVVIDAVQFVCTGEGIRRLQEFCGDALGQIVMPPDAKGEAEIGTLEDGEHLTVKHIATEGDWIIKGIQGEFYPCKPDIFEQTYEEVNEK
jgi:hypothetical protein